MQLHYTDSYRALSSTDNNWICAVVFASNNFDGVGSLHRHFLPLPKGSASMKAREANLQVLYEISCSQGQQPIQVFTG